MELAASLKVAEEQAVATRARLTDVIALSWLMSISSNLSIRSVVLQALSALPLPSISKFEELKPPSLNILGECLRLRDECVERSPGLKRVLLEENRPKYERLQRVCFRFYRSVGVGVHCLLDHISLDSTPCTEIVAPSIFTQDPLAIVKANLLGPERELVRHEAIVWLHLFHNALSDDVLLSFQAGTDGGNFDLFLSLMEIFLDGVPFTDAPVLSLNNLVFRPQVRSFSDSIGITDSLDSPRAHAATTLGTALRTFMLPFVCEVVRFGLFPQMVDKTLAVPRPMYMPDGQLRLLLEMIGSPIVRSISSYQSSSRIPTASLIQRINAAIATWTPDSGQSRRSTCLLIVRTLLHAVTDEKNSTKLQSVDCHAIMFTVFKALELEGEGVFNEYEQWEEANAAVVQEIADQLSTANSARGVAVPRSTLAFLELIVNLNRPISLKACMFAQPRNSLDHELETAEYLSRI